MHKIVYTIESFLIIHVCFCDVTDNVTCMHVDSQEYNCQFYLTTLVNNFYKMFVINNNLLNSNHVFPIMCSNIMYSLIMCTSMRPGDMCDVSTCIHVLMHK